MTCVASFMGVCIVECGIYIPHGDIMTQKCFPHGWPLRGKSIVSAKFPSQIPINVEIFVVTNLEQLLESPVIWDAMTLMWRQRNATLRFYDT